jgi:hypothetical protein
MSGLISTLADAAFRDYETNGVPASGAHDPIKLDIRTTFDQIDTTFSTQTTFAAAGVMYATLAAMNADLAHPAGTPALVYNDPTPANNAVYAKTGASGSGTWATTGIGFLPPNILAALPWYGKTWCQLSQLKAQLQANGQLQTVINNIPAAASDPANAQWTGGGIITTLGALATLIASPAVLNLTPAALTTLFTNALARTF